MMSRCIPVTTHGLSTHTRCLPTLTIMHTLICVAFECIVCLLFQGVVVHYILYNKSNVQLRGYVSCVSMYWYMNQQKRMLYITELFIF